jgi:GAF domain-containing protein
MFIKIILHRGLKLNNIEEIKFESKEELYDYMNMTLEGLISEEHDWLANLSNAAALLWMLMDDINWAGFYLYKNGELVLGPFQGKPACTHIQIGKGVCGTAAEQNKTQLVKDVHEFPGHIACDSQSNSEIVISLFKENKLLGVLDIDSPKLARFDEMDKNYLEQFAELVKRYVIFPEVFI